MKKYRDHYFLKAKQENYPARSVYKLKELQKQFRVLAPGRKVLDLGACPGSWTLYAAEVVGDSGRVLAVDLNPAEISFPPNVDYHVSDATDPTPEFAAALAASTPFDTVISDMAPKTTGIKFTDQARSQELCDVALAVAEERLAPGGSFVVKIFQGPDTKAYTDSMRRIFAEVKTYKPKSSRAESKEIFIVGLRKKDLARTEKPPQ